MKQYIDKDILVAEIERRKSQLQSRITELGTFESDTLGLFQEVDLYDDIISFINTLEVKDADFEEDIKNAFKAGYELGIELGIQKEQKGE